MIPHDVRVIALDAAGTIMEPLPAVHHAYCQVAASFGYHLDSTDIKQRFPQAMNEFFPLSWEASFAETNQIKQWSAWRGLVAKVLHEIPAHEIEPLFHSLWEHFRQPKHWHVYPDVEITLNALKQRGYILCVVSNFDQRLYDIAAASPEVAAIDHWFASVDVGYQKPCVNFFRNIERQLNVPSHQFLMVGDSLEADYQGAQNAGWHARWLHRNPTSQKSPLDDNATQAMDEINTIHSLHEL
jgi:putative hydrolase of the HAD superfamily